MRQHIRISDRAMALIRANTEPGFQFHQTGVRRPIAGTKDFEWDVPLSDQLIDRLKSHQMAGETLSDVIERALSPKAS